MSAIRRSDTKPELLVRSALHRLGYRFRKEYKLKAPGRSIRVDIAFPTEGLAVFVDGCYWHQCPEHGTVPKTNRDYWVPKLRRNVARDALVAAALRRDGWSVLRIWEHVAADDAVRLIAEVVERLRARQAARVALGEALTALDLFAGAGGSTAGLKQAGYRVVGAVELDSTASETYAANHSEVRLLNEDIRRVEPTSLREALGLEKGSLTLLNACPPCQGFSTLGNGDMADERNDLVTTVLPFIEELRPRAFVVENVPGLRRDQRLADLLDNARALGYETSQYVVNAVDFGVPQSRRRLIAMGVQRPATEFPEHLAELLPRSFRREPESLRDVLARAGKIEGTRDPVHRARRSTPAVLERIRSIPRNGGRFDIPEEHQLDCHKSLDGRSATAAYGRLRLDEPAPTLTTRCTTPACGRFVHPTEHRGISLREAALIQTFPPGYHFSGTYQAIEAQIGNAVPARLAEALGRAVAELLVEGPHG